MRYVPSRGDPRSRDGILLRLARLQGKPRVKARIASIAALHHRAGQAGNCSVRRCAAWTSRHKHATLCAPDIMTMGWETGFTRPWACARPGSRLPTINGVLPINSCSRVSGRLVRSSRPRRTDPRLDLRLTPSRAPRTSCAACFSCHERSVLLRLSKFDFGHEPSLANFASAQFPKSALLPSSVILYCTHPDSTDSEGTHRTKRAPPDA